MMKVYKYKVPNIGRIFHIPVKGPRFNPVHFGMDGTPELCMWAEVETDGCDLDEARCTFIVVGTGFAVPSCPFGTPEHVGTYVCQSGMVWHLYKYQPRNTEQ